ncbi:hypothetical protein HK099_008229 [Clydaea vesicula]|uniref:Uncharacterized protein n=1 Tax=Clydaea vesicula TaxID=447962 RepID=A0AAD5TVH8_9FUNG|nr:hypothetical protein HK099_008229 [Clydaea vesicula]
MNFKIFRSKLVKTFRFEKVKTEDEVVEGVVEEVVEEVAEKVVEEVAEDVVEEDVEEVVDEVEEHSQAIENAPEKCIEKLDPQDSAVLLEVNVDKEIIYMEDEDEDDDRPHIRCFLMDEKCLVLKYLDKNTDIIEPQTMEFAEVMTNKVMHEDDITLKTKVDKRFTTYWLYNKAKLDRKELSVTINSLTKEHLDHFIELSVTINSLTKDHILLICSGLHPHLAIDENNHNKMYSEQIFHTKTKRFISMHPTSVFYHKPKIMLNLVNEDEDDTQVKTKTVHAPSPKDEVVEGVVEEVVEKVVEEVEDISQAVEVAPEKCIEKLDLQDSAVLLKANVGKEIVCEEGEDEDDDRPHIRCCLMDEKCLVLKYLDKNTDFIEPRTVEFAEVMTNKVMHEEDLTLKKRKSTKSLLHIGCTIKQKLYKIKLDHRELSVTVNSLTEDHMDRFIALNVPYSTDF